MAMFIYYFENIPKEVNQKHRDRIINNMRLIEKYKSLKLKNPDIVRIKPLIKQIYGKHYVAYYEIQELRGQSYLGMTQGKAHFSYKEQKQTTLNPISLEVILSFDRCKNLFS